MTKASAPLTAPPSWRRFAWLAFYSVLAVLCVFTIWRALGAGGADSVIAALAQADGDRIVASGACVACIFAIILAMEQFALRSAGAPPAARRRPGAALVANAVSLGSGFGMLSGGALRTRLYASAGVDATGAFYVASVVTLMSVLGGMFVAALGLVYAPWPLQAPTVMFAAVPAVLLGVTALLALTGARLRTFTLLGRKIEIPGASTLLVWIGLGALDWAFSAAALFVLLPDPLRHDFPRFATLFAATHLAAMITGAPNGLGVFDAIMLTIAGNDAATAEVAAALVLYRMTAFLAPVGLGLAGLAALEARHGATARNTAQHRPRGALAHGLLQFYTGASWRAQRAPPQRKGDLIASTERAAPTPLEALTGHGPVLVLAPHPDDEALGCGGLIAACAAAQIPVHVVYLTDGRRSHLGSHLWSAPRLAIEREREAEDGARLLGLNHTNLTFLRHDDGALLFNAAARRQCIRSIEAIGPSFSCILAPWIHDPHPDHMAAAMIGERLRTSMPGAKLLSYPIWGRFLSDEILLRDRNWRGLRLDIRPQLDAKHNALKAHRTQMTPLVEDALVSMRAPWRDLEMFLTGYEIFFE